MSNKERRLLRRILIAVALFCCALPLHMREPLLALFGKTAPETPALFWVELALFLPAYAIAGFDSLWRAARNIRHGQVFDENFLMALATLGAFALGDFAEGVAVMLFYRVGEWFESRAVSRSRSSIAALMDIRPDYANLLRDGVLERVDPEEVQTGDLILVRPGERVPLDGCVEDGSSSLDVAALTGEPLPREIGPGDDILSGSINQTGLLTVRVTKPYGQSTVAKILELVESASAKKSRSEHFITRFARYYTPAVVIAAILLSVLPPFVTGDPFGLWIRRALTLLVISCPCALVISVPLSFFGGIGGAARKGILIKGGGALEALSKTNTVVFDKTGTLTYGRFAVTEVCPQGIEAAELLRLSAYAEAHSSHPIARSILDAYGQEIAPARIVEELPGYGVCATVKGSESELTILAGNARLMVQRNISFPEPAQSAGTLVHIAVNGTYAGYIRIEDEIKIDAVSALAALKASGLRTVMLTGDNDAAGRRVAGALGIDEVHTELLPADKVDRVEALLSRKGSGTLAFVGDGINDAPVLARADIGIAMGGVGSDAAIEAADVVIMTDELPKINAAMRVGRKTMLIVRQNIVFALGIKAAFLVLGALGHANMWAAVFADVGVSIIAILNAVRGLRIKDEAAPRRPM